MKIVQYLLQRGVSHSISNETIGGLFTKLPIRFRDDCFLNALIKKWDREGTRDCIERALSTNDSIDKLPTRILHQTI